MVNMLELDVASLSHRHLPGRLAKLRLTSTVAGSTPPGFVVDDASGSHLLSLTNEILDLS
jgi:hypothetical protein